MGDGILAEFGGVVEAVECAAEIQREIEIRNRGARDDHRMLLRRPGQIPRGRTLYEGRGSSFRVKWGCGRLLPSATQIANDFRPGAGGTRRSFVTFWSQNAEKSQLDSSV